MEKQKKNQIKKIISWVLVLSLVAVLAALPIIAAKEEPLSGPQASILSAAVEKRDISTAVLGGGTLAAENPVEITIPAAVKVKEYLVENGDLVTEGQPVAAVDRVSVMTAITQVQETLETLREELNEIRNETEATKLTAIAAGTVKIIYAAVDENVQDVMLRDRALAVLSLDNLMAVRIQRDTNLSGGDKVCVMLSDGTEVEGRVESNLEGMLTVTVEDKNYAAGQNVKVTTEEGDRIGTGELYIHSPWNVVAYSGTVSRVRVKEGTVVSAGQRLFDLKNDGHTAQFDSLSVKHREYEELMLELFKMYQSETVVAPAGGMITGIDENGSYMLSAAEGGWKVTLLANGPNNDQNSYTNYVGQVTEVGLDGLVMNMNPWAQMIEDYMNLPGSLMDTAQMTQSTVYNGSAPIYELTEVTVEEEIVPPANPTTATDPTEETSAPADSNQKPVTQLVTRKEWTQVEPSTIVAGDILLFAGGNGNGVVWVIKVGHVDLSQTPGTEMPGFPGGTSQGGGMSGIGGGRPGGGGGTPDMAQEEDNLYTLDTVTIASVTGQESVTVSIAVDEQDVLKLFTGQAASVSVDALPGQQFAGTVTDISASGENEGGNSKFAVSVKLDKIPQILPGMGASVSIVLETAEQVLCIPVAALAENGTQTQVYRNYDEETGAFTDPVTVVTGVSDGEYVQILTGVEEGDTVCYPYYDTLIISNAPDAGGGFPFG